MSEIFRVTSGVEHHASCRRQFDSKENIQNENNNNNNNNKINKDYLFEIKWRGEIYMKKSDIYNMGILMWEVITGETPYDCEHDLDLTLDIVNGRRPKNYEDIPREYATLIKQCWDAIPKNRPDLNAICRSIK
ncbi:hypothetical protein Glove_19g82 [Diversispora epigaea]|uniref:Protein kinase domain-containing protein n=1 Tax=Diversispora epigaea TaxID=1348612 RepID=A0A397JW64_9GLOM|nr:hypothetical protein Glove_19g82 [Diversispora epigaea]